MAMTLREFLEKVKDVDPDTEVVVTATKFHEHAVEQFVGRVSVTKLDDGRQVLAIDEYKHADHYTLADE